MNKIKCLEIIDALRKLEIIIKIEKINDDKILEIKKIEDMIKKSLDEFKKDKEDELKNKLSFLAVKNIFWERPDSIEKETEITRK